MSNLLHRVRLQHVRCLLACARHGNMRAAAESLAVTQPAVTKTIKELEDIVGQALMVRERQGVRLTPAGELFVRHAQQGVFALEQALGSVTQPQGGLMRLGVLPSMPAGWLARLVLAWRERAGPGTVRVVHGRNGELLSQLQRGELDAVLGRLAEPDRMMNLRFEPLWGEPLVVAMRPDHRLSQQPWMHWQRLDALVVLAVPGTAIRQAADGFLHGIGAEPVAGVVETLTPELARTLVLDVDAVWFTPLSAVRDEVARGTLAVRALRGAPDEAIGLFTAAAHGGGQIALLSALMHELADDGRPDAL
ncbi:pca operon transcription factor PcaQ [Aquabacterium olei]|uniref:Pca operon transcription factor PcaQ n=1 Tax=Aquabacterium olei TaxID=1296669 RepID=A0A2U8FS29_9BURK|nr:LysR substrate-binding domain-containing protein [Aquabacterium olei]AWI53853.1 pca operon transcription factor PcaQ [Aquabacterium olei]